MENIKSFIESGILESYVFGHPTRQEIDLVEQMAANFETVRLEIDSLSETFEKYALANAVAPAPIVKAFVMATVDFTERIKNGELPSFPPALHEGSKIDDYEPWLNRPDMTLQEFSDDLQVKIISYMPGAVTAIVSIKDRTPEEVHEAEYERFLIVEGTCDIHVEDNVYSLIPGNYFSIPLHKNHQVIVTSSIPCKVVLQRIAA